MIKSLLSSANRDTLVFHADSIPDTLKAKTSYKSFYSPVTIIKKATPVISPEELGDTPTPEAPVDTTGGASEELIETPEPEAAPIDSIQTPTPEAPVDTTEWCI